MRAILGIPDKPDSSYILVIRGMDEESAEYFMRHIKMYPTWGCLVFPEYKETNIARKFVSLSGKFKLGSSGIHFIFIPCKYSKLSDEELIKNVKDAFPPYREDDDPIIDRSKLIMEAIKGNPYALKEAAKIASSTKAIDTLNESYYDLGY